MEKPRGGGGIAKREIPNARSAILQPRTDFLKRKPNAQHNDGIGRRIGFQIEVSLVSEVSRVEGAKGEQVFNLWKEVRY
jgi:hypothetical protein